MKIKGNLKLFSGSEVERTLPGGNFLLLVKNNNEVPPPAQQPALDSQLPQASTFGSLFTCRDQWGGLLVP